MISNTDLRGAAVPGPILAGAWDSPAALEFYLVHHLPGRLRLRSAVLKAMRSRVRKHDAISPKLTG